MGRPSCPRKAQGEGTRARRPPHRANKRSLLGRWTAAHGRVEGDLRVIRPLRARAELEQETLIPFSGLESGRPCQGDDLRCPRPGSEPLDDPESTGNRVTAAGGGDGSEKGWLSKAEGSPMFPPRFGRNDREPHSVGAIALGRWSRGRRQESERRTALWLCRNTVLPSKIHRLTEKSRSWNHSKRVHSGSSVPRPLYLASPPTV